MFVLESLLDKDEDLFDSSCAHQNHGSVAFMLVSVSQQGGGGGHREDGWFDGSVNHVTT